MESKNNNKWTNQTKTDSEIDHTDGCQGGENWGMTEKMKGNTVNNTVISVHSDNY